MSETFLVHYILNTLPAAYGPFKISYNTHKDKWSINELLNMCVQEEGRLLMEMGERHIWLHKGRVRTILVKPSRKEKKSWLPRLTSRKNSRVSSVKRRDT